MPTRDMFYRNPDPMAALQDAMFGGSPSVPFIPTASSAGPEQSILERPDIQQLLAAMFPKQEPEKHPLANDIGARLGDALSAYAAGMGAGQRTDFLGQLRAKREQRGGIPRERAQAELGIRLKDIEAGRRTKEQTQDSELEKARLAEERKFKTDQSTLEQSAASSRNAADIASREKIAGQAGDVDKVIARIRSGDAKAENELKERLHKAEGAGVDDVEKRQLGKEKRDAMKRIKGEISGIAANLDKELQTSTPQAIRERLDDLMHIEGLSDEEKRDISVFYRQRLMQKLADAEMGAGGNNPDRGGL